MSTLPYLYLTARDYHALVFRWSVEKAKGETVADFATWLKAWPVVINDPSANIPEARTLSEAGSHFRAACKLFAEATGAVFVLEALLRGLGRVLIFIRGNS